VLGLIAKGYKNAEVADKLGLTPSTIGTYVRDIYQKLGISSRAQAALAADRLGLIGAGSRT
jgi:DNA-binding NarL/FixJ family response regulator